jgi:hypothetical protein
VHRWAQTIKHLGEASHPILITSMNEFEMNEETTRLMLMGYRLVKKGGVNKWKSLSPKPELMRKGVYYRNYYSYTMGNIGV